MSKRMKKNKMENPRKWTEPKLFKTCDDVTMDKGSTQVNINMRVEHVTGKR